jgi:hypothetical protein
MAAKLNSRLNVAGEAPRLCGSPLSCVSHCCACRQVSSHPPARQRGWLVQRLPPNINLDCTQSTVASCLAALAPFFHTSIRQCTLCLSRSGEYRHSTPIPNPWVGRLCPRSRASCCFPSGPLRNWGNTQTIYKGTTPRLHPCHSFPFSVPKVPSTRFPTVTR